MAKDRHQITTPAGQHPNTFRRGQATSMQVSQQVWVSPLPPAEELEKYRQILPTSPERIMAMAEAQATHRQYCEKRIVRANTRNSTIGVISAFVLGALAIGGGIYLLLNGKETTGLTALLGGVVSLVTVFIVGRRTKAGE